MLTDWFSILANRPKQEHIETLAFKRSIIFHLILSLNLKKIS